MIFKKAMTFFSVYMFRMKLHPSAAPRDCEVSVLNNESL